MNRRSFLAATIALPFSWRALAETAEPHWLFLGTSKGPGIYRAPWNPETGEVGTIELAATIDHPTFFARHPKLDVLYTTNERDHGEGATTAFRLNRKSGSLQNLGQTDSLGAAPCFVAVQKEGKALFAANYSSGSIACLGLNATGAFTNKNHVFPGKFEKTGPNAERQASSHMHCSVPSLDGRYIFACDLGADTISWYEFENAPSLLKKGSIATKPGDGPRHLAFHANGKWLYCINELGCVVTRFDWDGTTLHSRPELTVSTLTGYEGQLNRNDGIPNTASEIAIAENFLYAATRGADAITTYSIAPNTGKLTHLQTIATHGRIPRHFAISPNGHFLLCANQGTDVAGTDSLSVFRRDPKSGHLDWIKSYAANTPMFVQFI